MCGSPVYCKVSKARLNTLVDALKALGDVPQGFPTDRLFLAGVTQVADCSAPAGRVFLLPQGPYRRGSPVAPASTRSLPALFAR